MMCYDSATRQLILFGGARSGTDLGDTWVWAAGNWHHKSPPAAPLPRYSGSTSYDQATRQLILFGGWADNGLTFYSDTWTWTGCTWKELTPAATPPARARASMTFDATTGQLLLFGGWEPAVPYDWGGDTWAWTGKTWVNLHPAVSPPARDAAMAYDDATAQVILFGGDIDPPYGKAASDTWTWAR
jgi:hypothetical protein